MDDLLREFVTETHESLSVVDAELVRFEQNPTNTDLLARIFRLVHTIKGTCGFLGLPRLEALAHAAETLMGKFRDGAQPTAEAVTVILASIDRIKGILDALDREQREPDGSDQDLIDNLGRIVEGLAHSAAAPKIEQAAEVIETLAEETPATLAPSEPSETEAASDPSADSNPSLHSSSRGDEGARSGQTIRVSVDTLESLMTMVSELVLTRNQLLEIVRSQDESEFKQPLQRLSNVTAELQDGVMKTRMQPIGNAWQKLPRIVRDLSNELGKLIDLEMHGAETELDRQVLDVIKDPLTHMVRNAADHGLEMPAERRAAGKPERGQIRLSAYHGGGQIVIEVSDDGRGLDIARIKAKAVARGLVGPAEIEKMPASQIYRFIFVPGFSTADTVTNISGRGVGMDVVRTNIDEIGGTIDVRSVPGAGVSFLIRIPLTLAIVSALIVEVGDNRFAIPQMSVVELVRARDRSDSRIERIKDTPVLRLRNKLLPIIRLSDLLGIEAGEKTASGNGYVVVMQYGSQVFGVVVDAVIHTEEIVVKPLSSRLRSIAMFSGNTILGDGSVIMIVDPNGVARAIGNSTVSRIAAEEAAGNVNLSRTGGFDDEGITSLLVFRAGSPQPKAVPLSLVTRLEEIDATTIELSNGRHMVQYRGTLMPLINMNDKVAIRGEGSQPLLVFSDGRRSVALVVDEIIDIVEDRLDIQVQSETPGVLGSAVVKGQATEIVDVGHFLPIAVADWFRSKETVAGKVPAVLLVDDSPFFLDMLAPVLQVAGFSVATASSAGQALDMLRSGLRFDAVVTDVDMPVMDGFQFAQTMAADPALSPTPVIALTSMVSPDAVERGRDAGFHDFVAKFDREGLIAALREQTDVERAA
ncbi:MAG: chemotaxis protein CheW [Xanthobacteraceae bacterium]|uniref:hybrid sensor histidine kinase/response regulator n=1 Tax=Pseudolabrys sp. TaxID=1960880 RepID=UPI003D09E5F1